MTELDAFKILGLNGIVNSTVIKKKFFELCKVYHPDLGGSEEMMKALNEAYSTLKGFEGEKTIEIKDQDYGELLNEALNQIKHLNLKIEVCGSWIWVSGNTKEFKEILKKVGFRWASKKQSWYFRPSDFKSKGRGKFTLDQIREKYGSSKVEKEEIRKVKQA